MKKKHFQIETVKGMPVDKLIELLSAHKGRNVIITVMNVTNQTLHINTDYADSSNLIIIEG